MRATASAVVAAGMKKRGSDESALTRVLDQIADIDVAGLASGPSDSSQRAGSLSSGESVRWTAKHLEGDIGGTVADRTLPNSNSRPAE